MDFKCNHCKEGIDINHFELYDLYDLNEELKEIDCPHCGEAIYVRPSWSWEFDVTDEDGEEIED